MSLKDNLHKQRQQFLANAPEDVIEVMSAATRQLRESGIEKSCLTTGIQAPDISIQSSDGPQFMLYDALKQGPIILSFFRGHW